MSIQKIQEYDAAGRLVKETEAEVPDQPADPIEQLQAQVDALTDIVLGGTA